MESRPFSAAHAVASDRSCSTAPTLEDPKPATPNSAWKFAPAIPCEPRQLSVQGQSIVTSPMLGRSRPTGAKCDASVFFCLQQRQKSVVRTAGYYIIRLCLRHS